ncbi:XRE family transcriptional regulator [Methylomonas koyamae]|nr:XRE family transcriptional regulator [Methylomonas koyamae]
MTIYPGIKATMSESDPKRLLGAFIRVHRERLPPKSGGRRRTPGWRREELAEAALVSLTWITWLEQGRDVAASPAALARLADALRLTPAERASLFDLAGKRDPQATLEIQAEMPPELLALPTQFHGPAYLLDASWTARAWNAAAAELFVGWLDADSAERNLLRFVFLQPAAKTLLADWPERARRLAAEFRADFSRRPKDAALQALIDPLLAQSAEFTVYWQEQAVLHREGGERCFHHPQRGTLRFVQTTLLVAAQPDCKLVCLQPVAVAPIGKTG